VIGQRRLAKAISIICIASMLMGCSKVDTMKVKLGMINKDFEYINEGRINKVIIQNIRDKGFTFIVTDKEAIKDLYDIMSKAKGVENKITLEPDYELEFHEGVNKVHKFSYVAGLDKKDAGNLYSNDKIYVVSNRLDDDIIKNFWNIRSPKEFKEVYYNSILKAVEDYRKAVGISKKIGIDINDEEVSKFILTMDLEEFKEKLDTNTEMIKNDDRNNYGIIVEVKTEGYKTDSYKSIITFYDKETKKETKYYFVNKYDFVSWSFSFTKDKAPENF
jgi:hypothetical protein